MRAIIGLPFLGDNGFSPAGAGLMVLFYQAGHDNVVHISSILIFHRLTAMTFNDKSKFLIKMASSKIAGMDMQFDPFDRRVMVRPIQKRANQQRSHAPSPPIPGNRDGEADAVGQTAYMAARSLQNTGDGMTRNGHQHDLVTPVGGVTD